MDFILSDYVRRLRSNKNQLYRDLKPRDRIIKIIEAHILPEISFLGYTFVKSRMQLERKIGDFKQIVWFRTNSKNYRDEVVEFAIHLNVENEEYSNIIRNTYAFLHDYYSDNNTFIGADVNYLDDWQKERNEYWYSLHLDDNMKIVSEIIKNIVSTTSTYLDENSTFEKSLEYRFNKFNSLDYVGLLWIPDILILSKELGKQNIQKVVIDKYIDWTKTEEAKKDIEEDMDIYKIIEHIKNLL